jgi:hypothetical protein
MNSASMATNLLGRPVRLRERPVGCATEEGSIAAVTIDDQGFHFLILIDGRLVSVEKPSDLTVLD